MLQIMGWMGSLYLFVKGFEFLSNSGYRDSSGSLKSSAIIALVVAWLGAAVFVFAFTVQGFALPGIAAASDPGSLDSVYPEKSAAWHECVTAAKDAVEASACRDIE